MSLSVSHTHTEKNIPTAVLVCVDVGNLRAKFSYSKLNELILIQV